TAGRSLRHRRHRQGGGSIEVIDARRGPLLPRNRQRSEVRRVNHSSGATRGCVMKQKIYVMASLMAVAISMVCAGPAHAQNAAAAPFQIVETTIDDIHMAFRSGTLTARQLVQGYLDRINAYDKQGPNINSIITINPNALAEADRLDAALRASGL